MGAKIITILPSNTGAGGKFISTNTAFALAGKLGKDASVVLVDFNLKYPTLAENIGEKDNIHNIDNIIPNIDAGALTEELFMENITHITEPGFKLDILRGTRQFKWYNMFEDRHILEILKYLRGLYEYVILNVDCVFDNAGTVNAVLEADSVILVANDNQTSKMHLPYTYEKLRTYNAAADVCVVVNKVTHEYPDVITETCTKEGLTVLKHIPYLAESMDNMDIASNLNIYVKARFGTKSKLVDLFRPIVSSIIEG